MTIVSSLVCWLSSAWRSRGGVHPWQPSEHSTYLAREKSVQDYHIKSGVLAECLEIFGHWSLATFRTFDAVVLCYSCALSVKAAPPQCGRVQVQVPVNSTLEGGLGFLRVSIFGACQSSRPDGKRSSNRYVYPLLTGFDSHYCRVQVWSALATAYRL